MSSVETDEGLLGCTVGMAGCRRMLSDGTWLTLSFFLAVYPFKLF